MAQKFVYTKTEGVKDLKINWNAMDTKSEKRRENYNTTLKYQQVSYWHRKLYQT